jgi:hypothetical protein
MKISILPAIALTLLTWACNKPTPQETKDDSLRGKEYNLISEVKGFEDFNSFSTTILDDSAQFSLSHYKSKTADLFVLGKAKKQADGSFLTIAVDFMQFETATLGQNFVVGGSCTVNEVNDPELIGMFSISASDQEGKPMEASKVWRASYQAEKITPIKLQGVYFVEMGD